MKEFDEIPFVPCNDCSSWESCTQDAYERGKAEAKTEHDKECDTCLFSSRKEVIEEVRAKAISEVEQKIYELQLKYENKYGCAITEMYVEVVADLLEWIKGQKK